MHTSQLILGVSFLSVALATGCNRADTDEKVRQARSEMRDLAGRAGEQIADSWLATKIQAQYFADDDVKARDIRVIARDGVVLLRGIVDSESERAEALSIARNTDGVARVDDQLRVGAVSPPPAPQASGADETSGAVGTSGIDPGAAAMYPTDDASVTTGIQAKLFRDSSLKTRHIDVATQGGIVTLRGTVANDNERAQARLLAWTTHGVQRVDDVLTVDPTIDDQAQRPLTTTPAPQAAPAPQASAPAPAGRAQDAALEAAVRNRLQDAPGITVTVKDGVVLLEGTLSTAAAKARAIAAARHAPGVVQIVDRVRIER